MGEKLDIGDRTSVRTPMQWTSGRNGGFSNAAPRKLPRGIVDDGYSPQHVNASDQRHDPDSLLRFMRKLIERYRASSEIGWGELAILAQDSPSVLVHSLAGSEGTMVALHNFAAESTSVSFTLPDTEEGDVLVDLLVDGQSVPIGPRGRVEFELDPYGYRWLRIINPTGKRLG